MQRRVFCIWYFRVLGVRGCLLLWPVSGGLAILDGGCGTTPSLWVKWGFHAKNLLSAFVWPTVIFVLGVSLMAGYGLAHGRLIWQDHILLLLLLYPLWGILQQFLVQALGVANLMTLFPKQGAMVALPVGVLLFSLVHYPDGWLLMLATGVMACFFIPCYLRDRNLWPLGLYHGWLGTFFYLWVLGRDPWMDVFGR